MLLVCRCLPTAQANHLACGEQGQNSGDGRLFGRHRSYQFLGWWGFFDGAGMQFVHVKEKSLNWAANTSHESHCLNTRQTRLNRYLRHARLKDYMNLNTCASQATDTDTNTTPTRSRKPSHSKNLAPNLPRKSFFLPPCWARAASRLLIWSKLFLTQRALSMLWVFSLSLSLSLYVSMYLCIYVFMYLCIYVCMYLCTHVCMHACM